MSLTSAPVADLSPPTTELRSTPAATTKDKAGTTTTNNSLDDDGPDTAFDALALSAVEWAVGEAGQPVHARVHHAGADAKRNDEHAVNNGHHDDNHSHHHDDNTGTTTTTDGSNSADQASGDADGS